MGTLSKRPLRDFGVDHKGQHVEDVRSALRAKLEQRDKAAAPPPRTSPWFALASASLIASLVLRVAHRDRAAMFVGQWGSTLLMLDLYDRIVRAAPRPIVKR
jgi:hypothetical protein